MTSWKLAKDIENLVVEDLETLSDVHWLAATCWEAEGNANDPNLAKESSLVFKRDQNKMYKVKMHISQLWEDWSYTIQIV